MIKKIWYQIKQFLLFRLVSDIKIVCPAIKVLNKKQNTTNYYYGNDFNCCLDIAFKTKGLDNYKEFTLENTISYGFIDNNNNFVDPKKAMEIAENSLQLKKEFYKTEEKLSPNMLW